MSGPANERITSERVFQRANERILGLPFPVRELYSLRFTNSSSKPGVVRVVGAGCRCDSRIVQHRRSCICRCEQQQLCSRWATKRDDRDRASFEEKFSHHCSSIHQHTSIPASSPVEQQMHDMRMNCCGGKSAAHGSTLLEVVAFLVPIPNAVLGFGIPVVSRSWFMGFHA